MKERHETMNADVKTVYTIPEAARALKVSEGTIRRMIKSKEMDASKVGWQWRIKASSVNKHLDVKE